MILVQHSTLLLFVLIAAIVAMVVIGFALLRSRANPYKEKNTPYECGFDAFDSPQENARGHFNIQFYLIAILFIIFDIEILYLFPYAIVLKKVGWTGFFVMLGFVGTLTVGLLYEWKKGALEWT